MSTTTDDLEAGLRELFERQAESVSAAARAWDDPPMASVVALPKPRRSHSVIATIVATAAAIALVVGVAVIGSGNGVRVAGQPGSAVPVHFATKQVSMSADAMTIDVGGHRYTSAGSNVDVHSDPGNAHYQTLELDWHERGVEMRLYIYFAADSHDWWASGIATYDGHTDPNWVGFGGPHFRTALGHAYEGDVDLAASGSAGRLRLSNLRLQPFLPLDVCKNPTSKYAIDIAYDHVNMPNDPASGFGLGAPRLLDTATCTPVTNTRAFVFTWTLTPSGIAGIDVANDALVNTRNDVDARTSVDLAPERVGTTTFRVTARDRSTGQVVATAEVPVTVDPPVH